MRVLYIGGTGQISFSCVHRSVELGHETYVFNRGNHNQGLPGETHFITGDIEDDAAYQALAAERFDVVCQFRVFDEEHARRDVEVFGGNCGQYVFISSASAYHKPVLDAVITEATPLVNPYWAYSRKKAACEAVLLGSELPVTVVRPSHTYRTRFTLPMGGDLFAKRMEEGRPVMIHGDGTSLWTVTRAEDFAPYFCGLLGRSEALGEAYHITEHMKAYPWRRIVWAIGKALGVEPEMVCVPSDAIIAMDASQEGPLWGDKSWSVMFDNTKVRELVGVFEPAFDLESGQAAAAEHYRARRDGGETQDAALDARVDALIARYRV